MQRFDITGMSCAACSARVQKAVSGVKGVTECNVNLLTNSMTAEGTASPADIIAAVEKSGYGARVHGQKASAPEEDTQSRTTKIILKRLIASIVFLLALMYVSMGHGMFGLPLPETIASNPNILALIQLLLSAAVIVINQRFFISGFKGLIHGAPNMDTLVSLGSGASFIYSVVILFRMLASDTETAAVLYGNGLYFESAAMILTLITVGKLLESYSKGKTANALKGLIALKPKTARVIINGEEKAIPAEDIKKDDIFVVRAGESIPADGIITEGHCAVDESALTGESIPADKTVNDSVTAATVNKSGYIKCKAVNVGEDTVLAKIIQTVTDAAAGKAPIAKIADKVSGVFVPAVLGIAVITLIVWLAVGKDTGFALARAISVLVISCPCALGLATPVAVMVGNGVAAKNGILFKTAEAIEQTGKVNTVVLDKTGTVTEGIPEVYDILPENGVEASELLSTAVCLESKSEHPLAGAVMRYGKANNIPITESSDFAIQPGKGLTAKAEGKSLAGGKKEFIKEIAQISATATEQSEALAKEGKTPLFFAADGKFLGIIAVADGIKPDSAEAVRLLQNMGISVIMLTGDNENTARAIGQKAGIDRVTANVLPTEKAEAIRSLKSHGGVCMVGDGINDAPSLTVADIGMAIGSGTDIAIDSADVVLMKSGLTDAVNAIKISRKTLLNIKENLFWAFIYNACGIPLAAGVFINAFGWQLNPMFGAAAMSLSSFCVVMNALRLNFIKPVKSKNNNKEINTMTKIFTVKGMMCPHCEARVKQALEALPEIESATPDHKAEKVTVVLKSALSDDVIVKTITAQGYEVVGC